MILTLSTTPPEHTLPKRHWPNIHWPSSSLETSLNFIRVTASSRGVDLARLGRRGALRNTRGRAGRVGVHRSGTKEDTVGRASDEVLPWPPVSRGRPLIRQLTSVPFTTRRSILPEGQRVAVIHRLHFTPAKRRFRARRIAAPLTLQCSVFPVHNVFAVCFNAPAVHLYFQ